MANEHKTDRYTAMARIAGKDSGISEKEMPIYIELFHDHMKRSFGALDSIRAALIGVLANPVLTNCLTQDDTLKN